MASYNVKIAGMTAAIELRHERTVKYFQPYFTDEKAECSLCPTAADMDAIRQKFRHNDRLRGAEEYHYPAIAVEASALLDLLSHELLKRDTLLTHGSAVVYKGRAYLFIAPSGTGKSTHTRRWLELLGEEAFIINDDKPFIRIDGDAATVYANPWGLVGKPPVESAPLAAIVSLARGDENTVAPLSPSKMFPLLFRASLRGKTPQEALHITELEHRLLSSVRLFCMTCTDSLDAAKAAVAALTTE